MANGDGNTKICSRREGQDLDRLHGGNFFKSNVQGVYVTVNLSNERVESGPWQHRHEQAEEPVQ